MVRALLEVAAILVTIAAGMATLYHIYRNWWRRHHRVVRIIKGSDRDRQWTADRLGEMIKGKRRWF